MMKKHLNLVARLARSAGIPLAAVFALAAGQAQAAIDITAATAGITDASTAVLGVIAAMITMAVAVWGVKKVLRFFGR
jgi:uncharacterized membrane protein YdbT with pleckstrin-like domain